MAAALFHNNKIIIIIGCMYISIQLAETAIAADMQLMQVVFKSIARASSSSLAAL